MNKWRPNVEKDIFGRESVYLIKDWQAQRPNQAHWAVGCKDCYSEDIVRYGKDRKGKQRFLCKSCGMIFTDTDAPRGMRFPADAIASALNQFYESASLHKIQRQLRLNYDVAPDPSNVYRWVAKYTEIAVSLMDDVPVRVGDGWVADETVLKLKSGAKKGKGENIWFWDIIDSDTRFLLASHLSRTRTIRDAQILMERARRRAGGKAPDLIFTDKLAAYLEGIERTFGADTVHVQSGPFKILQSTRDIERFHGTLKERTKVMRALANRESAKLVLDGWLVHYNFFRPHGGLKGKTPAEAAGVREGFKNWKDIVRWVG